MATTGSKREAVYAGIIPARIPMMIQIEMAKVIMPAEM